MGRPKTIQGELCIKYLQLFPKYPSRTIARKIYNENSEAFRDIEDVRGVIKYYRGKMGKKNLYGKKFDHNIYELPESDCTEWNPFKIPSSCNKNLIFSDTHFPYHDVRAITTMITDAKKREINSIILNGDILDFYALSKYQKHPGKRSVNDEIWQLVEFITILQDEFPSARIFYKIGNHEERLEKYLMLKAPELLDMEEYHLGEILKIRGVQDVTVIQKQIIMAGKLPVVHGHEFMGGGSGGVNPARGLFLKSLSSALTSHFHRTSSNSERDITDKLMSTFSIACLCDLHPEYALLNKWNHGFAYIDLDGDEFTISNKKIYKEKVYSE